MTRSLKLGLSVFSLFAGTFGSNQLFAQGTNLQYQVANLVEDMRIVDERMRNLAIQMEEMRRENAQLSRQVSASKDQLDAQLAKFVTLGQMSDALKQSVNALEKRDDLMKNEIIAEVKKMVGSLAKEIGNAIDIPSPSKPNSTVKTHFPKEGIPEMGVPYRVVPGDTLESIAKKFNSRVDWIQNQNEIASARLLQVGQMIVIPQAEE